MDISSLLPPAPDVADTTKTVSVDANRLAEPIRVILFALGFGFAWDALFQSAHREMGINVPIAAVLLLSGLLLIGHRERIRPQQQTLMLFVPPLLFFAGMVAVRESATLTACNIGAVFLLFALLLYFWKGGDALAVSPFGWFATIAKSVGGTLATAFPTLGAGAKSITLTGAKRERTVAVVRGVALAVPILAVFLFLFANADGIFASALNRATTWLFPAAFGTQIWRLAGIIAVSVIITGAVAWAFLRREVVTAAAPQRPAPLGLTESAIVLGSLAALFSAFLASQTAYLFGGDARVQAVPDLTYAEYARHGFAELNIVAVLILLLVGGLKWATKRETPAQARAFGAWATALLVLTLPVSASSLARMQAYEAAYGATELRLYVDIFLIWLVVGLCWCGVTLWTRVRGGLGVYVCAVGFLVTLNAVNPDREIARQNRLRYEKTGRIDRAYLRTLSSDAASELKRLDPPSDGDEPRNQTANRASNR